MKLLVISHLFPNRSFPLLGIFVEKQLRTLAGLDVEIVVLSPTPYAPRILADVSEKWQDYHDVERQRSIGAIHVRYPRYLRPPGAWFRALSGRSCHHALRGPIAALRDAFPFDAVLANSILPDGEVAFRTGQRYGVPAYCYAVGEDVNVFPFTSERIRRRTRYVLEQLDGVIANGSGLQQRCRELAPRQQNVTVIYRGCDLDLFAPNGDLRRAGRRQLGLRDDDICLLYAGFFRAEKGLRELMAAFTTLASQHPKLRLCLAGTGELQGEISAWAGQENLAGRVLLPGQIAHRELPLYLNAADLFVFPSYHEGVPNAVVEAAACGLPIIGSRIPGIIDILGEAFDALVIPGSRDDLQQKIAALLAAPERRQALAAMALDRAHRSFDARQNAIALHDYLFAAARGKQV